MSKISKVCVIGAGVMGSGIAAHIANSGTKVLLLDVASNGADRNSLASSGIEKMLQSQLAHPKYKTLITPGNLEDDLKEIKNCQLVIEAIVEKLDIKQALYDNLTPHLSPETILASNTSTLPLKDLKANLTEDLRKQFMILHFFNPPRYMKLLELVKDSETDQAAVERASIFIERMLGKSIVKCNDTPGFVANRIGCFLLELVLRKTIKYKLKIEEVDYIFNKELFLPSTAIFGLFDLIGLDVMQLINRSLMNSLPSSDAFVCIGTSVPQVEYMIKQGYIGRKGVSGFYRIKRDGTSKIKEVFDLETMEYRALTTPTKTSDHPAIQEILKEFADYVNSLIPTVTDNIYDIDRAMQLGYSWKYGPFELFSKVIKDYTLVDSSKFYKGFNSLKKPNITEIFSNTSAILQQIDENKLCFSITSKMNSLNSDIFNLLLKSIDHAEDVKQPLYIYSDTANFSAGADLKLLLSFAENQNWKAIEDLLILGQRAMQRMKYSNQRVISAARGAALGGGCELLLHSHFVIANIELNAGLVEASLGLIPGWGGVKEMVLRSEGDKDKLIHNLSNIALQNKSSSADHFAESYGVDLKVNMNTEYLFEESVQHSAPPTVIKQGSINIPQFDLTHLASTPVVTALQELSSKTLSEDDLLEFERDTFLSLIKRQETIDKIKCVIS